MHEKMKRYKSRLNFSITIPEKWEVHSDRYEESTPTKQNLSLEEEYKEIVEYWKSQAISFDKFEAIYNGCITHFLQVRCA